MLPVQAQSDNTVIPPNVRVLSGPGENYVAIGAVFAGDNVQPLYRSEDTVWILIIYGRQTGWIPRDTVNWSDDIAALPVLAPGVTPSAPITPTPAIVTPTASPAQGFVLPGDADRAFVRSGPGRGYGSLGQLLSGTLVEPFARNEDTSWILIRYKNAETTFDGFGWVAQNLVQWRDAAFLQTLPIMSLDNLTPSVTYTPSISPSPAPELTSTPAPSNTPTSAPTITATQIPATATWTPLPTTLVPSATWTEVLPPTATLALPSATPSIVLSPVVTETAVPTAIAAAIQVSPTEIPPSPEPPSPTPIPASDTPVFTHTPIPASESATQTPTAGEDGSTMPLLIPGVIGAGVTILLALIYIGMFAQGMSHFRLYQDGFVLDTCPVCQRGQLTVETKQTRSLGIPRVRRTVRCDNCRSVLREKGTRRWLYAVDRIENPRLYERFNGQEVTDDELAQLR